MGDPDGQDGARDPDGPGGGRGDPDGQDAGAGEPDGQDGGDIGAWAFGSWRAGRPAGPSGVNPALIARLPYRVSPSVQSAGQPQGPVVTLTPEHWVYLGLPIKRRPAPYRPQANRSPQRAIQFIAFKSKRSKTIFSRTGRGSPSRPNLTNGGCTSSGISVRA
jgi:hypothetical protein